MEKGEVIVLDFNSHLWNKKSRSKTLQYISMAHNFFTEYLRLPTNKESPITPSMLSKFHHELQINLVLTNYRLILIPIIPFSLADEKN